MLDRFENKMDFSKVLNKNQLQERTPMAKEKVTKLEGVKIVTPVFRLSFPALFKPKAYEDKGKPKFSIVMLFPKKAWKTELVDLRKAVKKAAVEMWGNDLPEFNDPFNYGDEKSDFAGYEGMLCANADTYNKPGIFGTDGEEILNEAEIYGGCYARASLVVKAWEMKKKKGEPDRGVKFYLQGIKKYKDGERFGGGGSASDFDGLDDGDIGNGIDEDDGDEVSGW